MKRYAFLLFLFSSVPLKMLVASHTEKAPQRSTLSRGLFGLAGLLSAGLLLSDKRVYGAVSKRPYLSAFSFLSANLI